MHRELLAPLIDSIYETALEPSGWPAVMQMVTDTLGGSCSSVVVSDGADGSIPFAAHDPRLPQEAIADYLANFVDADAVRAAGARFPVGVPQTEDDFLGPRTAHVYNEFYVRWEWCHILGMYLIREQPVVGTLSVYRSARTPPFGEQDKRAASQIGRHLARAVTIHRKLDAATADRSMLLDCIDRLAAGIVFVDARGRVLLMNRAASEIVAQADGLLIEDGELIGASAESTRLLRNAIATVIRQTDGTQLTGQLNVPRRSGQRPYALLATPLPAPPSELVPARALIVVTDPSREIHPPADALKSFYSLSPSESALAVALCQGLTVKEIAYARDVSVNTVHSQLVSVQRKVGAARQAEIVSLLLRGPLGILREA